MAEGFSMNIYMKFDNISYGNAKVEVPEEILENAVDIQALN